jgi:hypothetical protein
MYFRHFSVKVIANISDYGVSKETSYPVLAIQTRGRGRRGNRELEKPENTLMLISNDAFKLKWVPATDLEQVDLT